ncbi:hypothetical protein EDM57_19730 [Brevibacillus gelatini]|uniref:Uncharacterized protein n=1 Tax=Brevibacillus gelatini TaxID=1655277 RepID=A0A3M8ASH5_9BACL|nr:hypothetical protein [Brevibacillus gelatini]RNB53527.1 hypothetical protein EDM57_19730 [Brevibacillus gelatini]
MKKTRLTYLLPSTGTVKQGEEKVRIIAPIHDSNPIELHSKKPHKKMSLWEKRAEELIFLLECVENGIITREYYENYLSEIRGKRAYSRA